MMASVNDVILSAIEDVVAEYDVPMTADAERSHCTTAFEENAVAVEKQQTAVEAPVKEEGPRARHLRQALRKALNNTLKACR